MSVMSNEQPKGTPGCGTVLGAFAAGLTLASVFGALGAFVFESLSASLLFIEIGLLAGVVVFLAATRHRLGPLFRIVPVPVSAYPLAILLGIALLFANSAATILLGPSVRDIELVTSSASILERVILTLTVVLAAPLVEEALFRGLLQGVLERRARPWFAIVGAAAPFALMHGPTAAIFFFFWSLPLGWIAWRTGSIRPGIVVHALNNMVGLMALLAAGPIDPGSLERGPGLIVAAVLILPVAALWAVHLSRRIVEVAEPAVAVTEPPRPES